ncbi:transporter [Anaplasmataceae bacterium AB001_6]|nr:transporter [Anaplasmataceae bacterium AB001_6]
MIPLYCNIFIGYIAKKLISVEAESMIRFSLYILAPIILFAAITKLENSSQYVSLPLLIFTISSLLCYVVYKVNNIFYQDGMRNIVAYSSGSSNTSQLGLPIAMLVLDKESISIYIIGYLGMIIFENTYGFYIAAKGNFPISYCIKRVLKLPAMYSILLGLIANFFDVKVPSLFSGFIDNIRSTYIVLGLCSLGIAVAQINKIEIDWKCIFITTVVKYVFWPILMLFLIYCDYNILHIYNNKETYIAMFCISIVPISITTMIVGASLNYQTEKLALMLLINTIAGMFYIPVALTFYQSDILQNIIFKIDHLN